MYPATSWLTRLAVTSLLASGLVITGLAVGDPAVAKPGKTGDGVAATEAEAVAEAAETGEPVEVLAARTETRDVYANEDGTFTANEHIGPVRTFKDGSWADIDTTLSKNSDGGISPASTTLDVAFSGGGDAKLIRAASGDRSVNLDWIAELPEPTLDGDTAVYAEVMPDVDLHVTALPDGFTHTLMVKTADAAANPDLATIDMPVSGEGATVSATDAGGVMVGDTTGGTLLEAAPASMWDSADQRARVTTSVDADSVTLEPDQELLSDSETEFPVAIDPVYHDSPRSRWAMVNSGYPSESYYKFDKHEGLGYCGFGTCNNTQIRRLLYKMSTSAYKSKDILSAEFAVTVQHYAYKDASHKVNLYKMPAGITSGTTWNSKKDEWTTKVDTRSGPNSASTSCSNSSSYAMEFDVKTEVAAAAKKGTTSLTLGLRNANESNYNNWMRMCNNGTLRVKYNTPPAQPNTDTMGMRPGGACTYVINADAYTNKKPVLFGTLKDADHGKTNEWGSGGKVSEQLKAQFKLIWDGGEWESKWSAAKASGSEFTLDLAEVPDLPSLPNDTPIGWILRADDGASKSPWSWSGDATRCRFVIDPTAPAPPEITSTDFPDGDVITPAVGEIGELTIDSTDDDIESYVVTYPDGKLETLKPKTLGGSVTTTFMPVTPGRQLINVKAIDVAGNGSANVYSFRVSVPDPAETYELSDPAGSNTVADEDGANPGTPGSGVELGVPGPGSKTAAKFDGSTNAYIATAGTDRAPTDKGFAAAAWVKIDDLGRDQTIVSMNGRREAGFVLGYDSTSATSGTWMLMIPDTDTEAAQYWRSPVAASPRTTRASGYTSRGSSTSATSRCTCTSTANPPVPRPERACGRRTTRSRSVVRWTSAAT